MLTEASQCKILILLNNKETNKTQQKTPCTSEVFLNAKCFMHYKLRSFSLLEFTQSWGSQEIFQLPKKLENFWTVQSPLLHNSFKNIFIIMMESNVFGVIRNLKKRDD